MKTSAGCEVDDFVSIDPVRWLVEASARASETMLDRTRGRVLLVARVFGDQVVDWLQLPRGAHAHVGNDGDALGAPLPGARHRLVEGDWTGWTLALDPTWDASVVESDGTRSSVAAWLDDGRARMCADGLLRATLPDDAHIIVRIGLVTFVVRTAWPARAVVGPVASDTDPTLAHASGLLSLLAVLLGLGFARSEEEGSLSARDVRDDEFRVLLREVNWEDAPVVELLDTKNLRPGGRGGAHDDAPPRRKRGNSLAARPADALSVDDVGLLAAMRDSSVLDGLLAGPALDVDALTSPHAARVSSGGGSPWGLRGRDGTLGGSGGVAGSGDLGIGDRGIGGLRGGGGLPILGERSAATLIAQLQDPIILGSLDRGLVDGTVKRNLPQIRYCYQRELTKVPNLAGKVVVKFVIAKDGSVSSVSIKSSTLNNASAEKCILERFRRFQFPEPKGGGIVIVSYPFIFAPG